MSRRGASIGLVAPRPSAIAGAARPFALAAVLLAAVFAVELAPLWIALATVPLSFVFITQLERARVVAAGRDTARLEAELRSTIDELQASRSRLVRAADTERRRIERDLHDGCQQRLIALRVKLALAEELVPRESAAVARLVREIATDAETALAELHALVHGIYPSLLADRGLVKALRALVREAPVQARLRANGVGRCGPGPAAAVYFTCSEALQNAAKYAGRDAAVEVSLRDEGGRLMFEVRDDGRGFSRRCASGSGLASMEDRVGALGGRLEIASTPGRGTAVRGWVPHAAEARRSAATRQVALPKGAQQRGPEVVFAGERDSA